MNGLKSNIGGKNGRQMQQGAGIPTLRIQADTPVPRSSGNTPVPGKTDKVQLPALSTTPRIVQQGKPCSQTTPRIPHPNQVNNFYRYGNNKNGKVSSKVYHNVTKIVQILGVCLLIGLPQIWFSAGLKILMLTLYILGCNEYQLDP